VTVCCAAASTGIVVGVSGAFPCWDEAIGTAVAANLRAIAQQRHAEAVGQGLLTASPSAHG
jgi:hypothetical protein